MSEQLQQHQSDTHSAITDIQQRLIATKAEFDKMFDECQKQSRLSHEVIQQLNAQLIDEKRKAADSFMEFALKGQQVMQAFQDSFSSFQKFIDEAAATSTTKHNITTQKQIDASTRTMQIANEFIDFGVQEVQQVKLQTEQLRVNLTMTISNEFEFEDRKCNLFFKTEERQDQDQKSFNCNINDDRTPCFTRPNSTFLGSSTSTSNCSSDQKKTEEGNQNEYLQQLSPSFNDQAQKLENIETPQIQEQLEIGKIENIQAATEEDTLTQAQALTQPVTAVATQELPSASASSDHLNQNATQSQTLIISSKKQKATQSKNRRNRQQKKLKKEMQRKLKAAEQIQKQQGQVVISEEIASLPNLNNQSIAQQQDCQNKPQSEEGESQPVMENASFEQILVEECDSQEKEINKRISIASAGQVAEIKQQTIASTETPQIEIEQQQLISNQMSQSNCDQFPINIFRDAKDTAMTTAIPIISINPVFQEEEKLEQEILQQVEYVHKPKKVTAKKVKLSIILEEPYSKRNLKEEELAYFYEQPIFTKDEPLAQVHTPERKPKECDTQEQNEILPCEEAVELQLESPTKKKRSVLKDIQNVQQNQDSKKRHANSKSKLKRIEVDENITVMCLPSELSQPKNQSFHKVINILEASPESEENSQPPFIAQEFRMQKLQPSHKTSQSRNSNNTTFQKQTNQNNSKKFYKNAVCCNGCHRVMAQKSILRNSSYQLCSSCLKNKDKYYFQYVEKDDKQTHTHTITPQQPQTQPSQIQPTQQAIIKLKNHETINTFKNQFPCMDLSKSHDERVTLFLSQMFVILGMYDQRMQSFSNEEQQQEFFEFVGLSDSELEAVASQFTIQKHDCEQYQLIGYDTYLQERFALLYEEKQKEINMGKQFAQIYKLGEAAIDDADQIFLIDYDKEWEEASKYRMDDINHERHYHSKEMYDSLKLQYIKRQVSNMYDEFMAGGSPHLDSILISYLKFINQL